MTWASQSGDPCSVCGFYGHNADQHDALGRALLLLINASRVSPELRAAMAVVEDELSRRAARQAWLTEALRSPCRDGWADINGAMDFYLRGVGSRWPEVDSESGDPRRLCQHPDQTGSHWLHPDEKCEVVG